MSTMRAQTLYSIAATYTTVFRFSSTATLFALSESSVFERRSVRRLRLEFSNELLASLGQKDYNFQKVCWTMQKGNEVDTVNRTVWTAG